jgi:hypothetical protein
VIHIGWFDKEINVQFYTDELRKIVGDATKDIILSDEQFGQIQTYAKRIRDFVGYFKREYAKSIHPDKALLLNAMSQDLGYVITFAEKKNPQLLTHLAGYFKALDMYVEKGSCVYLFRHADKPKGERAEKGYSLSREGIKQAHKVQGYTSQGRAYSEPP